MSMIGKSLAHYQITSQLGKGGMGEVYQAKDQKLGREVAIKVLPEEFARDVDRVARFQREAKLLASLNHPNIAAIHGVEKADDTHFLVLELVEGQTLAERIKAGSIDVEEALKLALQIAEALEAAHEKGVIHRDLKPANIKITPDGKVKVLDFGLAKAFAGDPENMNLSNSPTLSDAATQQGVILGTAAYMSPEQARGKPVDRRADIWAFGCVLFEMLTGRSTFSGKDVTDILAAVIRAEPEWSSLPVNLHGRLREVLERCLEKEAKNRYSGISDARVDIQKVLADPSGIFVQPVSTIEPKTKSPQMLLWASITVFLIIVAGILTWNLKKAEPQQVFWLDYYLPEDQRFDNINSGILAISPDGSKLAYSTSKGLYLRPLDEPSARLIVENDSNPIEPFFSPDGQWVGYWSPVENQLKKVSVSGGAPVTITNVDINPVLPNWNIDETIVYGEFGSGKVMRVPANGGNPEVLFEIEGNLLFAPQILPDGESILFTLFDGNEYQIVVKSIKSGEITKLMSMQGTVSRYVPTGHIVYTVGNDIFAVPFDPDRLELTGGQVSIVEGVLWSGLVNASQYTISDSGTLVYIPGTTSTSVSERYLVWVDKEGNAEPLKAPPNHYRIPKVSPDGTKIASSVVIDGNQDIHIWDIDHENMMRLTFGEGVDDAPLWTLDGKRIVFHCEQEEFGICWKATDGTGEVELLFKLSGTPLIPWSWSKDGNTLALMNLTGGTQADISILSMEGDRSHELLLQGDYPEGHPRISPDGRYIAYMSAESGEVGIYVRPFPDVNTGMWQVSTTPGQSPLWSPDGRELFYLSGDTIMAVPVNTESTFSYEKARVLFQGNFVTGWTEDPPFDIHPDGKRFIMMTSVLTEGDEFTTETPRKIIVALNWFEELKERVPVD